ncbi:glycolate oxidase subunit GlcF [Methylotetracoccus oryzae]|uniref:glycolate oxidase subunit GlcF n=1 Tax=Methylotetracoccus oryzae TaxID=1919059 RepID=UPI00111B9B7C|nr:glycolate oxidase subunit GlcF [Methylotetracoccus oryzae]
MQTRLTDGFRNTRDGAAADAVLRACVHCGFCNAACPTYRLLGDERDGPRGRIYLIKQVLEGAAATQRTQTHLDRCLSCRACETACPSGVEYGKLLEIGREVVERDAGRPWIERVQRAALRAILPYPRRFAPLLALARAAQPLLPVEWQRKLPAPRRALTWPARRHARHMVVLNGCVQSVTAPGIDAAAARVLDVLGISLVHAAASGCCGALSQHLAGRDKGFGFARRNIDAWWPEIERGAEAIVVTASGCAVTVKDYGRLLHDDPVYAAKAARVAGMAKSLGEVLASEPIGGLAGKLSGRVAFHAPCTLQHGQRLAGRVEGLLTQAGLDLVPVADAQLCCGSAGSYSLLQPTVAARLLADKIAALERSQPELILTDNIGCLLHLQSGTKTPVKHWIELLAESIAANGDSDACPG